MKTNLRKRKILSIVLIALLVFTTKIYAVEDHYDTTIKANPTSVKEGDKVVITLGISNLAITSGEKGIAGYTAKLAYVEDIFEYVSSTGTEKWEPPFFQNGYLTAHTQDGEVATTTQEIGSITLRVKKGAKLGDTNITLENFSGATMGTEEVKAANQTTKVTIVADKPSGTTGNEIGNTNNTVDKGKTNQVNTNLVNDNGTKNEVGQGSKPNGSNGTSTKPGKLPQTGDELPLVLVAIGIGTVIAISFYIRTKTLSKK